jgi:hypothetical protein
MAEQPPKTVEGQISQVALDVGHAFAELIRTGEQVGSRKLGELASHVGEDQNGLPEVPHLEDEDLS